MADLFFDILQFVPAAFQFPASLGQLGFALAELGSRTIQLGLLLVKDPLDQTAHSLGALLGGAFCILFQT